MQEVIIQVIHFIIFSHLASSSNLIFTHQTVQAFVYYSTAIHSCLYDMANLLLHTHENSILLTYIDICTSV
jgi:hypothetical protein